MIAEPNFLEVLADDPLAKPRGKTLTPGIGESRYTAVQLEVIPQVPGSASPTLLVISYHGPHTGVSKEDKKSQAKKFLRMVGKVVAK